MTINEKIALLEKFRSEIFKLNEDANEPDEFVTLCELENSIDSLVEIYVRRHDESI